MILACGLRLLPMSDEEEDKVRLPPVGSRVAGAQPTVDSFQLEIRDLVQRGFPRRRHPSRCAGKPGTRPTSRRVDQIRRAAASSGCAGHRGAVFGRLGGQHLGLGVVGRGRLLGRTDLTDEPLLERLEDCPESPFGAFG